MIKDYSLLARTFFRQVAAGPNGCWQWTGPRTTNGYGHFWDGEKRHQAHRWSLQHSGIEMVSGLVVDHLCRNPLCVNPDHLEQVATGENTRRGLSYRHSRVYIPKAQCPAGHEYTDANTLWIRKSSEAEPHRRCKACHNEITRRYRAKKRALAA